MPESGRFHQTLTSYAQTYLSLGWSIIPLYTDEARAKIPAVAWKRYQRRRADDIDARRWFEVQCHTGIGIVTGSISRLIVIDFDDSAAQKAFLRENPNLADTWIVESRRGWHLYFRTLPHQQIASRKIPGIDLLANGRYVVAPPTILAGHDYAKIKGGGLPKLLSDLDIVQLIRNFENDTLTPKSPLPSRARGLESHDMTFPSNENIAEGEPKAAAAVISVGNPACVHLPSPLVGEGSGVRGKTPDRITDILTSIQTINHLIQPDAAARPAIDDLARIYRSLVGQHQRNGALFKTACLARDCGFDADSVISALAGAHANQPATNQHHPETHERRRREAVRTIHSAFSRPPKRPSTNKALNLCNSIREALFNMKQTFTARTLEGLRLRGVQPGMIFTRQQAVELLSGIVGRDSVDAALNAVTPDGKAIFERKNPSPRPSPSVSTASSAQRGRQKNAFCSQSKPGKIESGRKQNIFVMPSNRQLCQILGVEGSVIDPLTLDDLRSAKSTRQAAHREKIKRAPGRYSAQLLSQRLGVSPVTLRRYNRQIAGLHVAPTFTSKPVNWGTLNVLPPEAWIEPGMFLEDERGRRYKPLLGIARKLLASGRKLKYMVQGWNTYWFGSDTPPENVGRWLQVEWQTVEQQLLGKQEKAGKIGNLGSGINRLVQHIQIGESKAAAQAADKAKSTGSAKLSTPPQAFTPPEQSKKKHKPPNYRRALRDARAEQLALRVYETINRMVSEADKRINKATARRWVDVYGIEAVRRTLNLTQQRQNIRHNIQRPAGFMATVLRSEAKFGSA